MNNFLQNALAFVAVCIGLYILCLAASEIYRLCIVHDAIPQALGVLKQSLQNLNRY